ncbi:MAG: WHG domain-containing protein [Mycobacterium sp.]
MAKSSRAATPRLDREQAVAQLVSATIALLADKGPGEIKARTVAEAAGLSTIAVYHHLGGLPELLEAVAEQGFKELGEAFRAAPANADPVTALFSMALASRLFAQANPHLYDLMFGLSTRGSYRPLDKPATSGGNRASNFQLAYTHLIEGCERLVTSGRVRCEETPQMIAPQLWSAVHGFVALELGGHLAQFDDPVKQVLQPMMVNVVVGLGDERTAAIASHDAAIEAMR